MGHCGRSRYPIRLLQECAPGGDELKLREVAKEETNDHILEVGIKAPLDFPAMEESGRHLMEAERNAQIVAAHAVGRRRPRGFPCENVGSSPSLGGSGFRIGPRIPWRRRASSARRRPRRTRRGTFVRACTRIESTEAH